MTAKKSINFYKNSAKAFFQGVVEEKGVKREPVLASSDLRRCVTQVCALNVSGLGNAINIAAPGLICDGWRRRSQVQVAGAVVDEGLAATLEVGGVRRQATIHKIETSLTSATSRSCGLAVQGAPSLARVVRAPEFVGSRVMEPMC